MLASNFTDRDEVRLLKQIRQYKPIVAIKTGDLAELGRVFDFDGVAVHEGDYVSHCLHCQNPFEFLTV